MYKVVKSRKIKGGLYLDALEVGPFSIEGREVASGGYIIEIGQRGLWKQRYPPSVMDRLDEGRANGTFQSIRNFNHFREICQEKLRERR